MSRMALRVCPICGGGACDSLHRQDFVLPEGHPLAGGYEVVCCGACGFVYADTPVSQAEVGALYGAASKYGDPGTSTGGGFSAWDRSRLVTTAERIAQYLPDKDSGILDIGCAAGGLLEALGELGYENLSGLDPSPACVAQAGSRRGIKAHPGSLSALPAALGRGSFDCLILSHVLEHLLDLGEAIAAVSRLLKRGGLLYVEVPDASRYEAFVRAPFQEFNTEHVNHFSASCLRRLFTAAGFEVRTSGRAVIRSSADTVYPVLYGVYEKAARGPTGPAGPGDPSLSRQIGKYVLQSQRIMESIEANLRSVLHDDPEIILWGAGQLAMKLLGGTSLAGARVAAIVDGNPVNQGRNLNGRTILAPEQVRGMSNPILVTSLLHEAEITDVIRNNRGMNNPIYTLLPESERGGLSSFDRTGSDSAHELEALLAEDPADACRRSAAAFDAWLSAGSGRLILFGAGLLGRKILECLRRDGVEPLGFADNDPAKWSGRIDGLPVWPPEEAVRAFPDAAFVVTIRSPGHGYRDSRRQLRQAGCERVLPVLPVLWKYPERLLPHYGLDVPAVFLDQAPEIRKAFALLADEESGRLYAALLKMRLRADFEALPLPSPDDQYFAEGVVHFSRHEFFVDCDAFDGDTIRSFLARRKEAFRRILAFEPDPANGAVLRRYVESLPGEIRGKIALRPEAVGAGRQSVRFDATGSGGSSVSAGGRLEVESVSLDELLREDPPTFIKFDVEGAEQDGLAGARELIRRARPLLAVCVYHRPDDLWRIPLDLHALDAGYRFYLRAHQDDGLDTVLYGIPERSP